LPALCECRSRREQLFGSNLSLEWESKILGRHPRKVIVLSLLCCWAVCFAQDKDNKRNAAISKPDLSGTWVLDLSQSDLGSAGSNPYYDELTLEIVHHEPELKILRTLKKKKRETFQKLIYHTNKRWETNPAIDGKSWVRSQTHWDGAVLVTYGSLSQPVGGVTTESMEKWELAPDGNTLKQVGFYKYTLLNVRGGILRVFKRMP